MIGSSWYVVCGSNSVVECHLAKDSAYLRKARKSQTNLSVEVEHTTESTTDEWRQ